MVKGWWGGGGRDGDGKEMMGGWDGDGLGMGLKTVRGGRTVKIVAFTVFLAS